MNRYTILFALLVASTFAVQSPPAGEALQTGSAARAAANNKAEAKGEAKEPGVSGNVAATLVDAPTRFIQKYVDKSDARPTQPLALEVVFFTVPHPLETHLAGAFDHNVDALQDGLQDAGYEFDSAWIPWREHPERDSFDDDAKERAEKNIEDQQPGVLLFRKSVPTGNAYQHGVLVFLISEKPTEGISLVQVKTAIAVLRKESIGLKDPIRILGPTFSGSLASLGPVLGALHGEWPEAKFVVRSGGATGGNPAWQRIPMMVSELNGASVDFGSAQYDYGEWTSIAESTLDRMGIDTKYIAMLSEEETGFGGFTTEYKRDTASASQADGKNRTKVKSSDGPKHDEWNLRFPRDISSLRTNYDKQGIFDSNANTEPWNRSLNLKGGDESGGDSIRTFGGASTTASQEAILFGISEFLKQHQIRAVIISATNEEDRVFLTQFLHVHDADVRVVLIGGTRLMMRSAMAQFRGDLIVDNYPMLPMLHDWTSAKRDMNAHVFADDVAEGTYFATVDLLGIDSNCTLEADPDAPNSANFIRTQSEDASNAASRALCDVVSAHEEYEEPNWDAQARDMRMPAIYVAAMGGSATWPVAENRRRGRFENGWEEQPRDANGAKWHVAMPFDLFGAQARSWATAPISPEISVSLSWKIFFSILATTTILYCGAFWLAAPVKGSAFAGMMPTPLGSFWLFKVILPASAAALAFRVLAWAVEMPYRASPSAFGWWWVSGGAMVLAPAAIASSAALCAQKRGRMRWPGWVKAAFLPAAVAAIGVVIEWRHGVVPLEQWDTGSILNVYREMHWESGLSLVPTGMLFLLALFIWSYGAGNGAALLATRLSLPKFEHGKSTGKGTEKSSTHGCSTENKCAKNGDTGNRKFGNERISEKRAERIAMAGMPLGFCKETRVLWAVWGLAAAVIVLVNLGYPPLRHVTTLESEGTTAIILAFSAGLVFLALVDTTQFVYLWNDLRGLLRALERQPFKRSFVPIDDFKWRYLWSFTGISLEDRRSINGAIGGCIEELYEVHGLKEFKCCAILYSNLMNIYSPLEPPKRTPEEMAKDRSDFHAMVSTAGAEAARLVEADPQAPATQKTQGAHADKVDKAKNCHYAKEREEVGGLDAKRRVLERLLCLIYIGFIQTIIARLHNLFLSISFVITLIVLGFAIYPFVPFMPLLFCGVAMLVTVGWAFFKVFSEMDTDPILSRIVNGDDRKLQGNFYMKFVEALALPLLALASSLLPGGAGRIIELARVVLSHTQ